MNWDEEKAMARCNKMKKNSKQKATCMAKVLEKVYEQVKKEEKEEEDEAAKIYEELVKKAELKEMRKNRSYYDYLMDKGMELRQSAYDKGQQAYNSAYDGTSNFLSAVGNTIGDTSYKAVNALVDGGSAMYKNRYDQQCMERLKKLPCEKFNEFIGDWLHENQNNIPQNSKCAKNFQNLKKVMHHMYTIKNGPHVNEVFVS